MWVATALGVGGAILGAGALGAGASIYGANRASNAQRDAAAQAQQTALAMYGQTRQDLAPYRAIGGQASTELGSRLGELTSPIIMDQAALEQTPGYQFTRTQGLKATQNAAAARGLGASGAALKGAANFATGLADQTYKTQFDIANTNQTNAYNRLAGLINTGENASAQTGTAGINAASQSGSAQMASGNAQAAAANLTGNAINNLGNNVAGYALYRGLYGDNNTGNSSGGNRFTQGNNNG